MSDLLQLGIVVPTFNERDNVATLVARLDRALTGIRWEAIFVDDEFAGWHRRRRARTGADRPARARDPAHRQARPVVGVYRGDVRHRRTAGRGDRRRPAARRDAAAAHDRRTAGDDALDIVIGSRFVEGGGTGDWDRDRVAKSAFATRLSRRVLKADLTDPMSGFFVIRASVLRALAPLLSGIGFKILLDIMTASPRPLAFRELGYVFRVREAGESKLDHVVAMEYLIALYDRMFGKLIPVRFAMFSAIGAIGAGVHLGVVWLFFRAIGTGFIVATVIATFVAMTFNFFLNNALTYRDRRLKGAKALFDGWISFVLVCAVGAAANVGVSAFLHDVQQGNWAVSALAGILIAAVWNFALSSRFTWGRYK